MKEINKTIETLIDNELKLYWSLTPEEIDKRIKEKLSTPLGKLLTYINNETLEAVKLIEQEDEIN